jgi:hypothetical protein
MEELEKITNDELNGFIHDGRNTSYRIISRNTIDKTLVLLCEFDDPIVFNNHLIPITEYVLKVVYEDGKEKYYHTTRDEGYEFLTHLGKGEKPGCRWECEYLECDELQDSTGEEEDIEIYTCNHPLSEERLCSFEYGVICPLIGEEI